MRRLHIMIKRFASIPYDLFCYQDKARLLAQMGHEEDALVVYDQFIERTPESFEGYRWKLWFISEHERYADGLTTCEQCLARHPQLAEAYEWRGHILKDLDRYEEARLSYEEAHRLDPKDEGILLSQTRLLLQNEAHRRSVSDVRTSHPACPGTTLCLSS